MNDKIVEHLNHAKTLYSTWGNLASAGYANQIMNAYANYRIQLTSQDREELCRIFGIYNYDTDGWELLTRRFEVIND